jgi:hypothetical protein
MKLPLIAALLASAVLGSSAQAAQKPEPSLDGGYVYTVEPGENGRANIVQTKLANRFRRVVIDGEMVKVIRTGRYRGYLMVKRHTDRPDRAPFDGIWMVRPDVQEVFMIPGTDTPDIERRNEISKDWRRAHNAAFDSDR